MRQVEVSVRTAGRTAAEVYPTICEFRRYPELTDAVRSVHVDDLGDGRTGCTWEVRFRRGILRWSEEDRYDRDEHRVRFRLRDGDLDHLVGSWSVVDEEGGCRVEFRCEFDMGIPTLAEVIEPIAADTLREHVEIILRALLGESGDEPADAR